MASIAVVERRSTDSGQAYPSSNRPIESQAPLVWSGFSSAAVAALARLAYAPIQPLTERPITAPPPEWHGMATYAASFSAVSLSWLYPAFLPAVAFVIVMTSVHYAMAEDRRL